MKRKIHPLANIFPMMSEAELQVLAEDIRTNGQREWIQEYRGQILDGRNRLKACELAGVEPEICEVGYDDDENFDPVAHVISMNLHRRQLTESQRALVAARIKEQFSQQAKKRQVEAGKTTGKSHPKVGPNLDQPNRRANEQAGKALGVSKGSVANASTVLAKGSKQLIEAVERGEVAISKAAKAAKSTPKAEQMQTAKTKAPRNQKTPYEKLQEFWEKADSAAQTRFRLWIDGEIE